MISFREIATRMDPIKPPTRLRGSSEAWLDSDNPKDWLVSSEIVDLVSTFNNRSEIGLWHKEDKGLIQMHRWPREKDPYSEISNLSFRSITKRHKNIPTSTIKLLWFNTWLLRSSLDGVREVPGVSLVSPSINKPLLEKRSHEIGKTLGERGYNFVGLCEVFNEKEKKEICDEIGRLHRYTWSTGPDHLVQLSSGLMTLGIDNVKIKTIKGKTFNSEGGGFDRLAEKGMLYTEIELYPENSSFNPCIDFFITHLHATEPYTRIAQIRELVDFIKENGKSSNSKIVAGDFNVDNRNYLLEPNSPFSVGIETLYDHRPLGEYWILLKEMNSIKFNDIWLSRGGLAGGTNVSENPEDDPDYSIVCDFNPKDHNHFCKDYPSKVNNISEHIPGKRYDYIFVEEPKINHSIIVDIPRIRRQPFWRGPGTIKTETEQAEFDYKKFWTTFRQHSFTEIKVPNFMSDHLGLEMDLIITPMSEVI